MHRAFPGLLLACALLAPAPAAADATATARVVVTATFGSRTALVVSSELLRFDLEEGEEGATAGVEFSAGARTHAGGEVVLTVMADRAADGPGGAADVETELTLAGEDGSFRSGLDAGVPVLASRWHGSGKRNGRLLFRLRAPQPGTYSVPVRFVLSAP